MFSVFGGAFIRYALSPLSGIALDRTRTTALLETVCKTR
ncbi:hypothetical protein BFJ65_g17086 [Fusarium oxysporum f. sp. cepae]|uniref:Uncharacterized protein n=1 Tax=Fusarium oxysporum f. sp. cepae TaxID=396571 RepID=A0A3L6MUA9_FUSOX|nr:hypothetical protein BFJ65_g17086 [Fusarium oxysporum f. sp. cepae]